MAVAATDALEVAAAKISAALATASKAVSEAAATINSESTREGFMASIDLIDLDYLWFRLRDPASRVILANAENHDMLKSTGIGKFLLC